MPVNVISSKRNPADNKIKPVKLNLLSTFNNIFTYIRLVQKYLFIAKENILKTKSWCTQLAIFADIPSCVSQN